MRPGGTDPDRPLRTPSEARTLARTTGRTRNLERRYAKGGLQVGDGTTTVIDVTDIEFTGATVADGGDGIAEVAVTGGGGTSLSHVDLVSTDRLFWKNGSSSSTLAPNALAFINFPPGSNLPLISNDTTTFSLDQYDPTTAGIFKSVYGLGIHGVPGTYNFYCGLTVSPTTMPSNPWSLSIPFQLVNLVNNELSGPDQSGQYMTFVPVGASGGYWQALFYQRVIVDTDTATGLSGAPCPFTFEIDNPSIADGGFALNDCYAFMAVDKIADDNGGY